MKNSIILFLLTLFVFLGCQETQTVLTDTEKEAMIEAVEKVSQNYWADIGKTYNNESIAQIKEYFDENSDSVWETESVALILNTGIFNKQASWLKLFEKILNDRISTPNKILESYYSVLSDEKVLEVIKGEASIIGKDSSVVGPFPFVNTAIWKNINNEWKIQFVHQSAKIGDE